MFEISIVIPCYNHGTYLTEALESLKHLMQESKVEVLIINDGSTDQETLDILERIEGDGWRILHQQNQGLAQARNNGIKASSGQYILPLDSDNLIAEGFIKKALDIFKKKPSIDIIYSDNLHFGDVDFLNRVGEFDPCKLISNNYIDACAIYRRSVWEDNNGYDHKIPIMGHEDWDFWVGAILKNKVFEYLPMVGFKYRVSGNSMLRTVTYKGADRNREYIYSKYNFTLLNSIHKNYSDPQENYKMKFLDHLYYLKKNRIKSILKILLKRAFY